MSNLLSKLSDAKVQEALEDYSSSLGEKIDTQLPTEVEKKEILKILEVINKKIMSESFQIDKSDLNDQQIGQTLANHLTSC